MFIRQANKEHCEIARIANVGVCKKIRAMLGFKIRKPQFDIRLKFTLYCSSSCTFINLKLSYVGISIVS